MVDMKIKLYFLLLLLLVAMNGAVYKLTEINQQQRIDLVLQKNIKTLRTHYEIILSTQKLTAQSVYNSTLQLEGFINILSQANQANIQEKAVLREELKKLLDKKYEIMKLKGVLQYHFILPNNEVFLRMHKPSKFGDDLTEVREDIKYVNETKQPIVGFTQGRTAHGFRNTFPIFDKNDTHIGAMEVSFSSDSFQEYLTSISYIHSHFLVKKDIFDAKTWARDDLILKYQQSAEHPNYMITMTAQHTKEECIVQNKTKLAPVLNEIHDLEALGKPFAVYVEHEDSHIDVVSFLPIKNISSKVVAWLVSYEENDFINMTLKSGLIIRTVSFFLSLILIYFIIIQIRSKEKIKREHNLLNDVLSSTEDLIFVTNFKEVGFSNRRFKELLHIEYTSEYHEDILNIFVATDGYLHKGLLQEGESFVSLIQRTPEDDRIVSVVDKHFSIKAFKIDISKTNYQNEDDYLVTLTDITKIQEKQIKTEIKAYYDGLTGVYNRNKFDESIAHDIELCKRYETPFSMAILDIDKFKDFNDTYGHLIGDEILIMIARYVENSLRATDMFARWGGEEFVILFREVDVNKATKIVEKIRKNISELKHDSAGSVTVSFGLTEFKVYDTAETMFKRCDEALYKAKENGRNRVEVL